MTGVRRWRAKSVAYDLRWGEEGNEERSGFGRRWRWESDFLAEGFVGRWRAPIERIDLIDGG
jgi:hypothetical protein